MAVQTQMSSLLERVGRRLGAANELHRDKPVDVGIMRLPGGIRDGVAKLQALSWGQYKDGALKGKDFFRAAAVVVSPLTHDGHRCAGLQTSFMVPFCDIPAANGREAVSFEDNFFKYQNLFKLLGVEPCPETKATDPTGAKVLAYFSAAAQTLIDPQRPPVYIHFSTRAWVPKKTVQNPNPEAMVLETWHGLAEWSGVPDPGSGAVDNTDAPPDAGVVDETAGDEPPADVEDTEATGGDEIDELVSIAENDPEGATAEGKAATERLEELAWEKGWTKEQTSSATSWEEVGLMAKEGPGEGTDDSDVVVGGRYLFAKRDKNGAKLKDARGKEFAPQEVEVETVDEETQTCTVKTVKDGKTVTDLRSKKPVSVKWDWLESLAY